MENKTSEILETIKKIKVAPYQLKKYLRCNYPETYQSLLELTLFLDIDPKVSIFERIYCIEHGMSERPKCTVCNKNSVKFNTAVNQYKRWCSISCSCKDPETLKKTRKTRLERYGSETYSGLDKSRKTRYEKNNGKWHSDKFGEKLKLTKQERYGDENYVNVEKLKKTRLERYGSETYVNVEKSKLTKLDHHGDPYWNNREKFSETVKSFSPEKKSLIKKTRKSTCIEKYGTEYATLCDIVKAKTRATCNLLYGVSSTLNISDVRTKLISAIREKSWNFILLDSEYEPLFTKDEYVQCRDPLHKWKWRHKSCGTEFESEYDNGMHHRCYKCWPNVSYGTSLLEQSIRDFVKQIVPDVRVYNKEPENRRVIPNREIDIYIPEKKIAIEVDGLYYHTTDAGKDKNYHLLKTEECEKLGILLIHIFEDEWIDHLDIVKSRLMHLLTKDLDKIYARECSVELMTNDEKDQFLEKYHIQGKDVSKVRYCLKHNGLAVAAMTFIKSRFNKNYEWELSRYATVSDCTIVGGASKLLAHFERDYKPRSLITYADRRWSIGILYEKLGFKFLHFSSPNYYYVKDNHRFSRVSFLKHKLKKLLAEFNESLSETENMKMNGYKMIYDSGNRVYVKSYS